MCVCFQIGYDVSCGAKLTSGVTGFCFCAVSSSMNLMSVFQALLKYAFSVAAFIRSLSDDAFQAEKLALIKTKLKADISLNQAAKSSWAIIEDNIADFSLREKVADFVTTITQDQLVDYSTSFFVTSPRILCSCACQENSVSTAAFENTIVGLGREPGFPVFVLNDPSEILKFGYPTLLFRV